MHQERLSFVISLSGTNWGKLPQFSIWVDDHVVIQSEVGAETQEYKFERDFDEGEHSLKIRLENKDENDTKLVDGKIVKDMLLNIDDIVIDDVSLGNLIWTADYILDRPQQYHGKTITNLDSCANLGWNGTYIFKFSSPFYIWLLEKL